MKKAGVVGGGGVDEPVTDDFGVLSTKQDKMRLSHHGGIPLINKQSQFNLSKNSQVSIVRTNKSNTNNL